MLNNKKQKIRVFSKNIFYLLSIVFTYFLKIILKNHYINMKIN